MRKMILAVAVAMAFLAVSAASASASVGWPASCKKIGCVNKHLNALHNKQASMSLTIRLLKQEVADLEANNPPSNNVLQGEIDNLQGADNTQNNAIQNVQQTNQTQGNKLACIGHKTVYYGQAYDYYEGYWTKYLSLDDAFYNGDISGPFSFLTDTCGGTF